MNESKTAQIKQIVAKIDTDKIASYPEHPKSKTLRQIIRYSQRILNKNNKNDQATFKLAVKIAYSLDVIINVSKYVKDEEEKKHYLEISKGLFENTIGYKE